MFQDIGSLLPKAIKKAGIDRGVEASRVQRVFSQIVGQILPSDLAKKVKPLYVKNKVLIVAALSSVVAEELRFQQDKIIANINKKLGKEVVKEIKYLV